MATQKSIRAQKVWLEKADSAKAARSGLGLPPLKLKIHREVSRHITAEEVNEEEEKTQVESPRPSVFHRLGAGPTQTSMDDKEEVLDRLSKPSVFNRLEVSSSQTSIDEKKKIKVNLLDLLSLIDWEHIHHGLWLSIAYL